MVSQSKRDPDVLRLWALVSVLFLSYLCVTIAVPIVPVYVTMELGLNNVWAGLAVGIAFLSTIITRAHAGHLSDRHGAKVATERGLAVYALGALVSLVAGLGLTNSIVDFLILIVGRLLIGLGESLVGVGIVAWGIGLVGPARSGMVMALVGAAIYGSYAIGAPLGLILLYHVGFVGAMLVSSILPCLGFVAIRFIISVAPHPHEQRPAFTSVIRRIWWHGLIVCLQGIGFATLESFFILHILDKGWSYAGLGLTVFGVGFVLVRIFFGHLPDRVGGLRVAIGSLAVEAVGQFLIWGANDPALALIGAFMTGLGCSMIFPAMGREVVHLVQPHMRGTALGGFIAFQDLAYGLTGPLAGLLADRSGYGDVFLVGGLTATLGFIISLWLRLRRRAEAS